MSRRRGTAHVTDIAPKNERENIKYSEPSHSSANIVRSQKKDEAPGTYTRLIVTFLLAGLVFSAVISAKVEATAIRSSINEAQREVDMLRSENTRMQAEIETKTSRKTVENYAENILGMQKLDKSQCEYISLESGNVIEIPDGDENIFVKLYNKVSDFFEYLRG